jgi:hypothetical protein
MKGLAMGMTLAAVAASPSAFAQQQQPTVTVDSLLKQEYDIAGVIPSSAGPGMFLRKGDKMYFCVVAETERSPAVATRYCKPVQ